MTSIRVNLADVEEPSYDVIDNGRYHAILTAASVEDSQGGPSEKNPTGQYVKFEFRIQGTKFDNWPVWRNAPLGGKGRAFLLETLAATEKFESEALQSDDLEIDLEDLFGTDVLVTTTKQRKKREGVVVDPPEWNVNVKRVEPYDPGAMVGSQGSGSESMLP